MVWQFQCCCIKLIDQKLRLKSLQCRLSTNQVMRETPSLGTHEIKTANNVMEKSGPGVTSFNLAERQHKPGPAGQNHVAGGEGAFCFGQHRVRLAPAGVCSTPAVHKLAVCEFCSSISGEICLNRCCGPAYQKAGLGCPTLRWQ